MLRVKRVAYAGAILMIGVMGCAAEAQTPTGSPTPADTGSPAGSVAPTATATTTATTTATATATTTPTVSSISVQLNPDRVTAGESSTVWILANCPAPQGGPAHTGTATSRAFVSGVTLNPAPAGGTPSPTGSAGGDWVRGQAQVSGTVRRGSYRVDVKCDGTNHAGRATLRVARPEPLPSDVPTRAPRAGGGGTFGQEADEGTSIPLGGVGAALGLALAVGVGVAVKRRRS
ncbi:hypothetical protein ACQEUU_07605 [Nonomuraea sp. CA-218870]|uniref:hypothetical protein n=1 Tax=Nonomuraea sp. CA-218870 TaxID=3239998 RepID=UPI003D8C706E